ncbi:MAG: hypothetical protein K2Y39_16550 [Candidatus Obscuribacterales bacterium]|nr:hypothetical protein [Candidatus Obscuribacterales bacterium]
MMNKVQPILEPGFNSVLRARREAFRAVPQAVQQPNLSAVPEITRRQSTHGFVIVMPVQLAFKIAKDVLRASDFAISNVGDRKLVCFKETPASVNICLEVRFEQLQNGATKVVFCNFNFGIPTMHRALIENNMRKLQRLMEARCA